MWNLICPLEMWVGNSPLETIQAQHLEITTAICATCTCYIGTKLFMWKIICRAFTMDSDTILVMSLTHTQKLAREWRIAHTLIYCPKIKSLNDVRLNMPPRDVGEKWSIGNSSSPTSRNYHSNMGHLYRLHR